MARKRKGRDIHGVLLLDKSIHMTSNDVLQKVKRIFDAKKAGHTGALDPLATGMLPICFGESTKFSQYLLDSDKRYRVIARLGQRTDTSDSDGRIIQEKEVHVTTDDILNRLNLFSGDIQQIPTMFSALKYQGRPLYDYARQGITVERESRPITIYENRFISFNNNELELEIHCSKGTYIRTIIDDLGESLGCGAHVIYLRRLQVSNYPYDKIISLSFLEENRDNIELLDSLLLPVDSPIQDYPKLLLSDAESNDILLGRSITLSDIPKQENNPIFRLYSDNIFIGIGKLSDGILSPKRLIQTESA